MSKHENLIRELRDIGSRETDLPHGEQQAEYATATAADPGGTPPNPAAPDAIEGYTIDRELSSGAQGVVYKAVQESTKRVVAIKVMREGPFAGVGDRARFDREVQILAKFNHPNIVTIHDSGTAAGRFYFVMNYIPGQALDEFMAERPRPVDDTLDVFVKICEAVQAAHLRGIIHRDLKPSNIRVDGAGEPHVLDFGLARPVTRGSSVGHGLGETCTGQFLGSPPWASPEQAQAVPENIDLRSDVYSLGVILYQMLTGKFPYSVTGPIREVLDNIQFAEPTRPSTIRRQINDEIETILLKCLKKEPDRRYQTAGELARDVQRYRAGEAIDAKRDSGLYILRKTLRRYWVPASVAASFFLIVSGAAVGLWLALDEAQAQRTNAERQVEKREKYQTLFGAILFSHRGRDLSVGEVFDGVARRLEGDTLRGDPEVRSAVQSMIGEVYLGLGRYPEAREHLEAAIRAQRSLPVIPVADLADSLERLGKVAFEESSGIEEARLCFAEAKELRDEIGGESNQADGLYALGGLLFESGDIENASSYFREAYRLYRQADGRSQGVANCLNDMAYVAVHVEDFERAEALYREAVARDRAGIGGDEEASATALNNLGLALLYQGYPDQGAPFIQEAFQRRRGLFPEEHKAIANSHVALGFLDFTRGNLDGAETHYRTAAEMQIRLFGADDHLAPAFARNSLAAILRDAGRKQESEELLEEVIGAYESVNGSIHVIVPLFYYYLPATMHLRRGDLDGAERLFNDAAALFEEIAGDRNPHMATVLDALARVYAERGKAEKAEALCRQALEIRRERLGPNDSAVASSLMTLAEILGSEGTNAEAVDTLTEAVEIRRGLSPSTPWLTAVAESALGEGLAGLGRFDEAEPLLLAAHQTLASSLGAEDPRAVFALQRLVTEYEAAGMAQKASEYWRILERRESDSASSLADTR